MCDLCYLRVRCLFLYIDTFIYGVRVHLFGVVFIFYPLTPSVLFELNCFFSLNIAICRTRHPFKTVLLPRCFYYFDKYSIFFYCTSTFLYSPVKFTLTIVLVAMNGTRTSCTHIVSLLVKKNEEPRIFFRASGKVWHKKYGDSKQIDWKNGSKRHFIGFTKHRCTCLRRLNSQAIVCTFGLLLDAATFKDLLN